MVSQDDYDFLEEKKHGILDVDSYTDTDWVKYADNMALSSLDEFIDYIAQQIMQIKCGENVVIWGKKYYVTEDEDISVFCLKNLL